MRSILTLSLRACLLVSLIAAIPACSAQATDNSKPAAPASPTISWEGHTWRVTNGGMAGVAKGNPANVSIDSHGYVHMRIVKRDGIYTAAEMFSTDLMGYGTYQWWIQGKIDDMDKSTVLGLFPYGPCVTSARMLRTSSTSNFPSGITLSARAPAMRTSPSIPPQERLSWARRKGISKST